MDRSVGQNHKKRGARWLLSDFDDASEECQSFSLIGAAF
jgi:hypothetical protein